MLDRSLFRISHSLALGVARVEWAWPGLGVQPRVFNKGYKVFNLNSALVLP